MTMLRPLAAFLAVFVFALNSALGAPPAITTQPASQTVIAGAAVTLTVSVSDAGPLTYQWQKNGLDITGATSATYSIASALVSQSGNYTVIVTKASESTTSNVAILTVTPDPSITTQPASRVVIAGATVHFSVVATGTATITYQWKKNGTDITGATGVNYSIFNAASTDAGNYTVVVKNDVGTATSATATLVVNPLPVIATQPASVFVNAGGSATFSVGATGTGTLSYQWQKGTTNIAGATSASLTINPAQAADAASYRVIVTDSIGTVTSSDATLIRGIVSAVPAADGFAASATGGGSATANTVTTAADFRTFAEDTTARVIRVSGTLNLGATKVAVKSNKTIQGVDDAATLIGNLELAAGVSNVIIRGLNITNPNTGGDGISVTGASNVYITHCTLFDCADGLIDITAGADNVTVSWCEFYYTPAQTTHRYAMTVGAATGETKALRVTLHHNRWFDRVDQSMPVTTWGHVHMYNNVLDVTGTPTVNTAATKVQASAQLLSERNQYTGVLDPLVKSGTGLIRASNNIYTNTTLTPETTAEPGIDTVFTPSYSYEMHSTAAMTVLQSAAGNTAGAASTSPATASATANSTATTLTAGGSFTLSATLTGFIAGEDTAYQWRFNNAPLQGGDRQTLTFTSAQVSNSGIYTVLVLKPSGGVVSSPVTITVNAADTPATPPQTTTDGGGAPSAWFFAALSLVALGRRFARRGSETTSAK